MRQGPHQEAQKSSRKTFPFMEDKRIESPFKVAIAKSRRGSVIFGITCCAFVLTEKTTEMKRIIKYLVLFIV